MTETDRPKKTAIVGFLIAGAVLVGVSILAQSGRDRAPRETPPLRIAAMTSPDSVTGEVRFLTDAPLVSTPMGWAADDMHLHVLVDSVELMPGPSQLRRVAADTFAWMPPALSPGDHVITLFWGDMRHRPVGDSARSTLRIAGPDAAGTLP